MTPGRCIAYRFGSYRLDLEREALLGPDGQEIPLRPKSFAMFLLLVRNAGRLVSQDTIMKTLWPDVFVTENNITQRIHEIRSALGQQAHQILRTRHRRGYMFVPATVAVLAGETETSPPDVEENRTCGADMPVEIRHQPQNKCATHSN